MTRKSRPAHLRPSQILQLSESQLPIGPNAPHLGVHHQLRVLPEPNR
jgi:hypothetical protein